jgi:large subunit ribosomal protein L22
MEAKAILRYARISPQKCRLVADTVRGAEVSKALNSRKFMPKKGADIIYQVLWSAVENAQNNQGADVDELKVTKIHVDAAPMFKRFGSKAKGRGTRIIKRNSHITVAVGDGKKDE